MVRDADQSGYANCHTVYFRSRGGSPQDGLYQDGLTDAVHLFLCGAGDLYRGGDMVQGTQLGVFLVS